MTTIAAQNLNSAQVSLEGDSNRGRSAMTRPVESIRLP
jgi:hypothetical protein